MIKKVDPSRLSSQSYVNSLIKMAKDYFSNEFNFLKNSNLKVTVTNKDTNLLKETAENTRKAASRGLDILNSLKETKKIEGEVRVSNLNDIKIPEAKEYPKQIDVNVLNQKEIAFPEIKIPTEIKVKNLNEIKFPAIKQEKVDFSSLEKLTKDLKTALSDIYGYLPRLEPKEIKIPDPIKPKEYPKSISIKEAKDIIDALQGVRDDLAEVYKVIDEKEMGTGNTGTSVISSSPTITNINVNGLRGLPKSTAITIGVTPTKLPTTALRFRRSLIIYNNSANTIYLGGSDVTTSNGFPVDPASYSPPIDASEIMTIYGISTSISAVRVLEVSSEREGA